MTATRTIRFEVPSEALLKRLAAARLPVAVEDGDRRLEVFRDVYYDTPGGELERKGAIVRIRHAQDGRCGLRIDIREVADNGVPRRHRAHGEVSSGDPEEVFAGDSEPARLLRALVAPERLARAFELETMRSIRRGALPGEDPDVEVEIAYETLTVRRG
ncbi:MAG TPA: CYTH domain-containing protein, partial [Longimicrobiales bacterium]|nr:CYTH domain-containing protein [Longimicrobiales bacterium]